MKHHSVDHKYEALDHILYKDVGYDKAMRLVSFQVSAATLMNWVKDFELLEQWALRCNVSELPPAFVVLWMWKKATLPSDTLNYADNTIDLGFNKLDLDELVIDSVDADIPLTLTRQLKLDALDICVHAKTHLDASALLCRPAAVYRYLCARAMLMPQTEAIKMVGRSKYASALAHGLKLSGSKGDAYRMFVEAGDSAQVWGQYDLHKRISYSQSKGASNGLSLLERVLRNQYSTKIQVDQDVRVTRIEDLSDDELNGLLGEVVTLTETSRNKAVSD